MSDTVIEGFLRLKSVLAVYPVSKSTWWQGVREGKFPAPIKLSEHCTAWRSADIRALCERISNSSAIGAQR